MRTTEQIQQQVDYDLHGLAGIRLINASAGDVAAVTRQLGPIQASLTREPDIIIRFVDRLPASSSFCYLGVDDAGFTEDDLLLLQSKNGKPLRVKIPFEQIGRRCEIVCETGVPKVPLLIPILNLTVLGKGVIPLHAAAFTYNGTGVVVTGWAKGGKTETLLAFMARGAQYVGDEWVYISEDGRRMYGIPEPIRVWDSHLQDLPQYRAKIGSRDRARLRSLRLVTQLMERRTRNGRVHASSSLNTTGRLLRLLKRQQYVQLPPQKLFGRCVEPFTGTPDKIFFVVSHESGDVKVQPLEPRELVRRMVFSLQYERMDFMSYYFKFRFAFPEARNAFIEHAEEFQRDILMRALADKPTYAVYHPYPAPIPALFDAISPFVDRPASQPSAFDLLGEHGCVPLLV
jgi:hypothetical protein